MSIAEPGELSKREREIALAYSGGESYREIGARLFISPSTVRTHLGTIYRKLGVSSKIELLRALTPDQTTNPDRPAGRDPTRWTTLAVMPFRAVGTRPDQIADGFVTDIVTRLARLRSVRVIARGSVFALAERGIPDAEAARLLGVDYLATGLVRRKDDRVEVAVELVDTRAGQTLWADRLSGTGNGMFDVLDEIGGQIVATVASEIEIAERNRAVLARPDSLGAWESFHRGLWHMYRFREADNAAAQALFRRAVDMDPTFSRAWAGLSFTHFQNAFLLRPEDRSREIGEAFETAGRGLEADGRDPSTHWAMGRALWLRGAGDQALAELDTAVALAPNFSPGHYALAFVNSQSGDPAQAIDAADYARALSPFDPLLFAIMGARAMALFRNGAFEEAADVAATAAERPNSHRHVWVIAVLCLAAAGRAAEAHDLMARVRAVHPGYGLDDFFAAFRFGPETVGAFRSHAHRIGIE